MASYGLRLLTAALVKADLQEFLRLGKLAPLYEFDPGGAPVLAFVSQYVGKHGELPPIDVVEDETGVSLPAEDAAVGYLLEKTQREHVRRSLVKLVDEVKGVYAEDPLKALDMMGSRSMELIAQQLSPEIVDFKQAAITLWPYLVGKWSGSIPAFDTGWQYVDLQCGGMRQGDLISIVGRPQRGKSWVLLWLLLGIWARDKVPVVFVSMEMSRWVVLERLAALFTKTNADFFKHGQAPTMFGGKNPKVEVKEKLNQLQVSDMPPFIVVDANMAGEVDDVVAIAQQYRPGALGVDGGYLLENDARTMYEGAGKNCRGLKKKVTPICPTAATWQFAKLKDLKKGQTPTVDNIGYSDVIAQDSSIILGLLEEDDASNIEKVMLREMKLLKGRGGEVGTFPINWNFLTMDFGQYVPPAEDGVVLYN